jgi:hypothetical protein
MKFKQDYSIPPGVGSSPRRAKNKAPALHDQINHDTNKQRYK